MPGNPPFFVTSSTAKPSRRDLQPPAFEDANTTPSSGFCCRHNFGSQAQVAVMAMAALTLIYHNLLRYQNLSLRAGLNQDYGGAYHRTESPFIFSDCHMPVAIETPISPFLLAYI
jgi:hypothetical protein